MSADLRYIASAVAFIAAAFLAYHDKSAWGWMILAGVLASI